MNNVTPEYQLIDYRLFDPSRPSLFKVKANERAEFKKLLCSGFDRCQAYAVNSCTMWRMIGRRCPYGKIISATGFTRRAVKFYDWIRARREEVKDISRQLDRTKTKIYLIGDYVFFPYPFWSLGKRVPLEEGERGGFMAHGIEFIPKERFTVDFFQAVVCAKPQALLGGEITQYQREEVPKIVLHAEESLLDLFREWKAKYPETAGRFETRNHVGRSAIVSTLPKGTTIPHKNGAMEWDGEAMIVENYKSAFLPVKAENARLIITPRPSATVKITSNDQVGPETKFAD